MKTVELYARVRHAVLIEGISERAAADRFGINARTVSKMLKFSVPPGYVRTKPPFRPKLDEFTGVIDAILAADKDRPKKQRHTSKRIFERLRDEHGFTGKITIVKDYVAGWRQRTQEMFVPLVHPPGHAQADFGEAIGVIGGVERKIHFFAMDLPHSDAIFVVGYPAETVKTRPTLTPSECCACHSLITFIALPVRGQVSRENDPSEISFFRTKSICWVSLAVGL